MDEGFDADDTGTDTDVTESTDIDIEPFLEIPVEQSAMDSQSDIEPSISEQEFTVLQNEADELEIEPFEEAEPDFYTLQPTDWQQEQENSGTTSLGTRVMAGALAPFAALDPMAVQIENINGNKVPNEVPAITMECPLPATPEQVIEQLQTDGWVIIDGTNENNVNEGS